MDSLRAIQREPRKITVPAMKPCLLCFTFHLESSLSFLMTLQWTSFVWQCGLQTKCVCVCICMCVCSPTSSSLQPHGLKPTRLLHLWDSPGTNTDVGFHSLLQGIFPTQGSNQGLLYCGLTLYRWATWNTVPKWSTFKGNTEVPGLPW